MDGRVFLLAAAISAALPLAAALRITEICPRPEEADPNGRESGWVELFNDGDAAVDLGEYELQRFNLGKKASAGKFSNLPAASLAPGEYFIVYTSEEYDNAEGLADEFSFSLDSSVVTARGSVCADVVVRQDTGIDVSGLPAPSDMGSPQTSVVLAQDDSGLGFYLLAKTGWMRIGTPRISPLLGVPYGMRLELDYVNREVRAMVREGDAWVSLADSAGGTVFALASGARALARVGFAGSGRIDRLDGYRAETRPYHRPHFYIRLR